jgi:hypothetical protein
LQTTQHNLKEALIEFPWLFEYPLFIQECNITQKDDTFYIIDRFDTIMPLQDFTKDQYINFLVLSGGEFVDMFILYQKKQNQLLGFIQNNKVISL